MSPVNASASELQMLKEISGTVGLMVSALDGYSTTGDTKRQKFAAQFAAAAPGNGANPYPATSTAPPPEPAPAGPQFIATDQLLEIAENWQVYRRPSESDAAFRRLCESVAEHGILSPLEVSADNYIISGHRRLAAARAAGLAFVPAVREAEIVAEMDHAERIRLVTERNAGQRIKSDSELMLEAAASVDPEEAVREAKAAKLEVLDEAKSCAEEVFSRGKISRFDPSKSRGEMLEAALDIIAEFRREMGAVCMTGRQVHYKLLNRKVRTSTSRAGYVYGTRRQSAKLLSRLLTDARSFGLIPAGWIDDPSRKSILLPAMDLGEYVREEADNFCKHFWSDVHREQPHHVELLIEKDTMLGLFEKHVARPLRLPLTSMHGYGSYPAAEKMAQRFLASGKDKLIVVYASDFDPEGMDMPRAFKKYLQFDHDIDCTVLRAAVTREQIEKYNLPPDADVKLSSSRAADFIAEHGRECWELDSMPPRALVDEVLTVAKSCLDIDAFNRALEREREQDIKLARLRAAVQEMIKTTGAEILGEGEG
jgi:hypothetical protein